MRSWPRVWGVVALLLSAPAFAQDKLDVELDDPELSELANTVWAMTLPERDFGGGCVVGFLAFKFQPNGYFIYNNRISGWWRLDTKSGNIRMRTREGLRFLLTKEGDTLRVPQNTPFMKRGNMFTKCGPSEGAP
ncbi:MAG TPA: hypothetical protein VFX59_13465 [Polyangiales bacterium]|nr:hypothetical protein [Polyangiales bacterium]